MGRAKIEGATITLQKVTRKDAGEYRCEVSASGDTVQLGEINITLKVLGRKLHLCDWVTLCSHLNLPRQVSLNISHIR